MGQISNTRHNKSQEHTQKVIARVGNIKIIIKQKDLDIRTTDFSKLKIWNFLSDPNDETLLSDEVLNSEI